MWGSTFRSPSPSGRDTNMPRSSPGRPLEIKVRDLDAERAATPSTNNSPLSMGWLLRLFRSDFFDAFFAVTYLYRYRESRGVHDYLCNELYQLSDADLETFMPQVCNLLVHHARNSPGLERFVMDKCADSMHMALQVYWFLQAAVEDAARVGNKETESRCRLLRTRCETAAVNGSHHAMLEAASSRISAVSILAGESPFSQQKRQIDGITLFPSSSAGQLFNSEMRAPPVKDMVVKDVDHDDDIYPDSGEEGKENENVDRVLDSNAVFNDEKEEADHVHSNSDDVPKTDHLDVAHVATAGSSITSDEHSVLTKPTIFESQGAQLPEGETITPSSDEKVETDNKQKNSNKPHQELDPEADFDPMTLLSMKQERFNYFNDSITIAKSFVRLSMTTKDLPQDQRQAHLSRGLEKINDILLRRMQGEPGIPLIEDSPVPPVAEIAKLGREAALRSVHLPLTRASSQALRILRVNSEEAVILTSRTRAPYMVNIEVLPTDMLCSDKLLFCEPRVTKSTEPVAADEENSKKPPVPRNPPAIGEKDITSDDKTPKASAAPPIHQSTVRRLSEMTPAERQRANVRKVVYGDAYNRQPEQFRYIEEVTARAEEQDVDSLEYKSRQAVLLGIYGELWSWKEERILAKSPFKDLEGTRLMPFIVKAGDDLRQEQLAIQLISQFKWMFEEEGVDVFVRPFTVMSVSSEAGFVEVIPDSVSVHSLKKRTPNFVSLLDYFERAFGANGSASFKAAQRRFIRSMAGYSLVTYFLQIKDRHNGNIMIDAEGRIIHIDFGFMLTNSPGSIKFENVPFKLTEEYLQVICAKTNVQDHTEASKTEGYRYFQELFVLGLLAARKHHEKITTLVEIMTEGTSMPCMTTGHSVVESLRTRFALGMPEEQCINFALGLIEESRLSWRSASYDRFQAYSNGYR